MTDSELPQDLLQREQEFHDQWASTIDIDGIRVLDYFEACTAPENRFILKIAYIFQNWVRAAWLPITLLEWLMWR
jgi:hypothetical protein